MPGPDFAAPLPPSSPPIAQVASEAATRAALDEVTDELRNARRQGRMIESLPLEAIEDAYLVRDRLMQDDEDMEALLASLRARGQQTPIEVTALPDPGNGPAYGLISGWRRLYALNRLYKETGEARFSSVKALVIAPESAQEAYVAMVEENEIRANLSLYERARIALRAAREGIYPTPRHAVLGLFASAPRAKRSKIGRFVTLVEALDGRLAHPTAIPEKLGLDLARALSEDAGLRARLETRLLRDPPRDAAEELRLLAEFARKPAAPETIPGETSETEPKKDTDRDIDTAPDRAAPPLPPGEVLPGLRVRFDRARHPRIELSGAKVDDTLFRDLWEWLVARGAVSGQKGQR